MDNTEKAGKSAKPGQIGSSEQQTLTLQQALDLAVQHHSNGNLPEANRIYQQILQTHPNQPMALHLLGLISHQVGKNDRAIDLITKALAIKPDYRDAHMNLGYILLALGREKEGLDELEWRLQEPTYVAKLGNIAQPMWDGTADLNGRTILLWPEQGLGDTIKWASCISQLETEAGRCILEVPPKLLSLFTRSFPKVEVHVENKLSSSKSMEFDFHLPLGSLYRCLYPNIEPLTEAYLTPDPIRVA